MRLAIAVLAALFLALPARAADDPQAVYAKLHAATLAGNIQEMLKYAGASQRAEISAMQGKAEVAKMMSAMLPKTYTVTSAGVNPDGKTAELRASGMHAIVGAPAPMYGLVKFISEGGEWKVASSEWSSDKPRASPSVPAAAAAPKPDRRIAAAPAAEATPAGPSAAERAAAKRLAQEERDKAEKRRHDALVAQCVIKPVMTDAKIAKCREASR